MALTDAQVKKAGLTGAAYKLFDSGGLFLFVSAKGYKSWRQKYRFGGKEKLLVIGPYPAISLRAARERRDAARAELRDHKDPIIEERKRAQAAHAAAGETFEPVARRWHEAQLGRWSKVHATKVIEALERDVFPAIGKLPLVDVQRRTVLAMLRKIEKRGAIDTAKRVRQHVSAVFEFARGEGLFPDDAPDPAGRAVVRSLLPTPVGGSQPGVGTPAAARELHAVMDASTANALTKLASRLLGLTFVRPGLVPTAEWPEFEGIDWNDPTGASDAAEPVWRLSAARMKLHLDRKGEEAFEHVSPLVPQAVDVLRAVHRLTGRFRFVFHSVRSTGKPMSNGTIGHMYHENGYKGVHVPHGWRTAFSTSMNEIASLEGTLEHDRPIIDAMLSHIPRGSSASEWAYNRAKFMPRRWELARRWADLTTEGLVPAAELLIGTVRAG